MHEEVFVCCFGVGSCHGGGVSPAFAAAQRSKVEVLSTPPTVYQGETFQVVFKVTKQGGNLGKWWVEIPKAVISQVLVPENSGLTLSENGDYYSLRFNPKKVKNGNIAVSFTVSATAVGSGPLLTLYKGEMVFVEQRQIEVLVPELFWSFDIPTEVSAGSTLKGSFLVSNYTGSAINLNVNTHFAMYCLAYFEMTSYPSEALSGHYFDGVIHQYSWNNYSIQHGETLTWTFQAAATSEVCGNPGDRTFELIDNTTGVVSYQQAILVR